jgi:hypothetical protein
MKSVDLICVRKVSSVLWGLSRAVVATLLDGGDPMSTDLSRRRLGYGALGATLIGSSASADSPRQLRRQLPWTFAPVPVTAAPGSFLHVFGGPVVGPDTEPSTIGNFKGSSGIAIIGGNVTRTNIKTGEQQSFPFSDTDLRFMTGTFISIDGKEQQGTFAFV